MRSSRHDLSEDELTKEMRWNAVTLLSFFYWAHPRDVPKPAVGGVAEVHSAREILLFAVGGNLIGLP